ncbi:MAG: glycine cleavage system protein GcvH [Nitrospinota bacterium]
MEFREKLYYTKEHEWALEDDGLLVIGITDYAQSEMGDVVFVELPEEGSNVRAGESFGVVESVKSVSDLYSPVSGEIAEVNGGLESEPELVNSSPFGDGWMIKIKPGNKSELEDLMNARQYEEYTKTL